MKPNQQPKWKEEELKELLGTDEYYQGLIRGILDIFKRLMIIIGVFGFIYGLIVGAIF